MPGVGTLPTYLLYSMYCAIFYEFKGADPADVRLQFRTLRA